MPHFSFKDYLLHSTIAFSHIKVNCLKNDIVLYIVELSYLPTVPISTQEKG